MSPPWVLAVVIAAQFAFAQVGSSPEPSCSLKFERIHYSTSVKRDRGVDAVKLNIKSICTIPQRHTDLTARMYLLKDGESRQIYESLLTRVTANPHRPKEAEFLEFWFPCKKGDVLQIRGTADGVTKLANSKTVPVSDFSGKFSPVLCDFPAR